MSPGDIKSMISGALRGVRQALRGKLASANAEKQVIIVQLAGLNGETYNGAELFQQPGLRSVPLPGMQPIIVPLNGNSANSVVVAMSNGQLFVTSLAPGEVAIFNESDGVANSVVLRNGKIIDITCDTLNIHATNAVNIETANLHLTASAGTTLTTPTTAISGSVSTGGGIAADGDIKSQGVSLPNHSHGGIQRGMARSDPAKQ